MMIHSRHGLLFGSATSTAAMESIRVCLRPTLAVTLISSLMLGNAGEDSFIGSTLTPIAAGSAGHAPG